MELLRAETTITRNTATKILPPSYQPSSPPCSLMPKPRARAAQAKRIRIVVSLKASNTKYKRPFGGGLLYVLDPNISRRLITSPSPLWIPRSKFVPRAVATPSTPSN